MSQYEEKGGLLVPTEKKEPRRFASVRPFVEDGRVGAVAISTDGAAFIQYPGAGSWTPLPDLPNG